MYATAEDLTAWLAGGDYADQAPADPTRLLTRAWEVIDEHTRGSYTPDPVSGLVIDPTVIKALTDATCAQVEQWFEVGEESDIAGIGGSVTSGGLNLSRPPDRLAPRAARILRSGRTETAPYGLLNPTPFTVSLT